MAVEDREAYRFSVRAGNSSSNLGCRDDEQEVEEEVAEVEDEPAEPNRTKLSCS